MFNSILVFMLGMVVTVSTAQNSTNKTNSTTSNVTANTTSPTQTDYGSTCLSTGKYCLYNYAC